MLASALSIVHMLTVALACYNRGKPLPDDVPHQPDLILLADCIYVG